MPVGLGVVKANSPFDGQCGEHIHKHKQSAAVAGLAWGITAIVMVTVYLNPHPPSCPWHAGAEVLGAPNIKWCETTLCGWISEPANTWSNALYLLVALVVHLQCRRSPHAELRWLGPAMGAMGLLSGVYHASNNYLTQVFDFVGMYLLTFWFLVINLRRNGWIGTVWQQRVFWLLMLAGVAAVHLMYLRGWPYQLLIAAATVAIIVTEFTARRRATERVHLGFFLGGLAWMAVAQAASLADLTRAACDPDNHVLQGHALWHLLSAVALYCTCQHYRRLRYPV